MGRPLAFALAVVGILLAVALLDRGRELNPPSASLPAATPTEEMEPLEPSTTAAAGDGSLLDCLSSVAAPGSVPASPPLTPRGVDEIADRVERLRRLRFDGAVDVRLLTADEINREVSSLIDEGSHPGLIRRQGEALELLGAIPPGADLLGLTRRALDSQVLGLFVPETQELLVARSGEAGAIEAITVAHELEHALAYDALGLPLADRPRPGRGDRDLAALALVEGDATLAMSLYAVRYIPAGEQLALLGDPALSSGQSELDELPYIIQAQLIFPYEAGLAYACERYSKGGWEAVDRAYANPPRSTAELLDPAAGPVRTTEPAPIPALGSPWRRTLADEIGAAELSWLFEAPGDDPGAAIPDAAGSASDWRGGSIALWQRGNERALGVSLAERPGGSLCEAIVAWYGAANPNATLSRGDDETTTFSDSDRFATIGCAEGGVRLGIAPEPESAQRLATASR